MFLCEKKSYCGTLHGRDPFSYQLASGGVVSGIQWVPEEPTPVLPTQAQPANAVRIEIHHRVIYWLIQSFVLRPLPPLGITVISLKKMRRVSSNGEIKQSPNPCNLIVPSGNATKKNTESEKRNHLPNVSRNSTESLWDVTEKTRTSSTERASPPKPPVDIVLVTTIAVMWFPTLQIGLGIWA